MAVNPSWGLMQPVDIGGTFQAAFQQGKQQRAQSETQNALAALAQDPNADINALAKYNPQLVMQVNQQRAAQQQKAQQAQVMGDALTGNPQAQRQVAYFDTDLYLKLQGQEREQAKEGLKAVSRLAAWADTPEKFDAAVRKLGPDGAEYIGRFADREVIMAQADNLRQFMEDQKPDIGVIPGGAAVYGKNAAGASIASDYGTPINGPQASPQAPPQQGGGQSATYATPDQVATLKASMGEQGAMEYLQSRGIAAPEDIKSVNGQEYFLVNGQWFDNPEGR